MWDTNTGEHTLFALRVSGFLFMSISDGIRDTPGRRSTGNLRCGNMRRIRRWRWKWRNKEGHKVCPEHRATCTRLEAIRTRVISPDGRDETAQKQTMALMLATWMQTACTYDAPRRQTFTQHWPDVRKLDRRQRQESTMHPTCSQEAFLLVATNSLCNREGWIRNPILFSHLHF